MFELKGRVALVTGAGQGVGAAVASALAGQGARVIVNDLYTERAEAVVAALIGADGQAVSAVADITDLDAARASFDDATSTLGPVDILVNNAGLPASGLQSVDFLDTTPSDWDPILEIGLRGVLNCTNVVLPGMVDRGWGRVISIVSDAGRVGEAGWAVYGAAKAGVAGFTRSLAKEVGPSGVTCNCLSLATIEAPSGTQDADAVSKQTRRYARRRLGRPADVAPAVVWLASDGADWVTGQTVPINGGFSTS